MPQYAVLIYGPIDATVETRDHERDVHDGYADELIASVKSGFYVTEVFGHGVDMLTGEYSRGASGFWIENGKLAYPVSEVTIASNLKDMFMRMVPANDIDRNFATAAPTLLIEGMTLAGD